MTISRVVLLAVAATGAWASDTTQAAEWDIAVCMNPGGYAIPFYLARATVSQILKQAGIRIEWHSDARACAASGVSIAIYEQTPSDTAAGELARAQPYDGGHVALFYDRVENSAGPAGVSRLLGHVLAHEIVHMLQDVATHSARGLMKQKWDSRDYVEMRHKPLRLTDEDILRIHAGLEKRAAAGEGAMRWSVSLLVMNLWASTLMSAADIRLTACLPTPDEIRYQTLMAARGYATQIYRDIGVDLRWKGSCNAAEINAPGTTLSPNLRTLGIRWSSHAPDHLGPRAYASAFMFQPTGIRVELYLDRILVLLHRQDPNTGAAVLGHILAHEIGHVLLQKEGHAEDGLMKGYWTTRDEEVMRTQLLSFEEEDASTIRDHLCRQVPPVELGPSPRIGKERGCWPAPRP